MTHTRGQAALEFLTTYGWAFLVILVMIGALAYFGVISPNKFLPERCTFEEELACKDFQATYVSANSATLNFYITNNLGNDITVNLSAAQSDTGIFVSCTTSTQISAGSSLSVSCPNIQDTNGYPSKGTKTKFKVAGNYTIAGGLYPHETNGEIFTTLQ